MENDDQNPGKDLGNVNDPKNPVNEVVKKIKRCKTCFGVGHDSRNCPFGLKKS
ncbi:hypothetical protein Lser_V15G01705 [Lactuca serriola]